MLYSAVMGSVGYWAKSLGDNTLVNRDPRTIVWVPLILVVLFILRGLGDFTQTYFMGYVGRRVVTRLRGEVFRRVLQFPISYFDRNSAGTLLSRLTYNTEQIGSATTDSVVSVAHHDAHDHLLDRLPPVAERAPGLDGAHHRPR